MLCDYNDNKFKIENDIDEKLIKNLEEYKYEISDIDTIISKNKIK